MQKTQDERLALIELAKVVAQFPFLEDDINPLIVRLSTKGTVTPSIVVTALRGGLNEAREAFRRLYFNKMTLTEADMAIRTHLKENGIALDN
jgi:hypothetical protein